MVQKGNGKSNEASGEKKRVRSVKAKPKPQLPMKVRIVHTEGKVALVEWSEGRKLHRVMIPISSIGYDIVPTGAVKKDELASGMPYGVAWEEEDFPAVDAEALANELRREGIWTSEDLMQRVHLARAAIQRAYINPLLTELVEKYRR